MKKYFIFLTSLFMLNLSVVKGATFNISQIWSTNGASSTLPVEYYSATSPNRFEFNVYTHGLQNKFIRLSTSVGTCSGTGTYNFTFWLPDNNYSMSLASSHFARNFIIHASGGYSACSVSNYGSNEIFVSCPNVHSTGAVWLQFDIPELPMYMPLSILKEYDYKCNDNSSSSIQQDNQNTENIINNANSNSQNIINNQNENAQNIINGISENFKSECRQSYNLFNDTTTQSGRLANDGSIITENGYFTTDFIKVGPNSVISVTRSGVQGSSAYVIYDNNRNAISRTFTYNYGRYQINVPANGAYVRISENSSGINSLMVVEGSSYKPYEKWGEICKNILEEQNDQMNNINNGINNLDNTLNNSNVDDKTSFFNNISSLMPENGVITQLLTLPITMFQKILTSINGSCTGFALGSLYGHNIFLPCINLKSYLGDFLWNIIDVLFSGLFVLVISKRMIKTFDNFTSFKEGDVLE